MIGSTLTPGCMNAAEGENSNMNTSKAINNSSSKSSKKSRLIPLIIGGIAFIVVIHYFLYRRANVNYEDGTSVADGSMQKLFEDAGMPGKNYIQDSLIDDSTIIPSGQENTPEPPQKPGEQLQHTVVPSNPLQNRSSTENMNNSQQRNQAEQESQLPPNTPQSNLQQENKKNVTKLQSQLLEMLASYDPKYSLEQLDPIIYELAQLESTSVDVLGKAGVTYVSNFSHLLDHYRASLRRMCEAGTSLQNVLTAWQYWYDLFKGRLTFAQTSDPLLLTAKSSICAFLVPSTPQDGSITTPLSSTTNYMFKPTHTVQINENTSPIICKIQIDEKKVNLQTLKGMFSIRRKYLVEITQLKKGTLLWFHPFLKLLIRPKLSSKLFAKYEPIKVQNGMEGAPSVNLKELMNDEMQYIAGQHPDMLRITNVNRDLSVCNTLPRSFVAPIEISDEQLLDIAYFRIKNRLSMVVLATSDVILIRTAEPLVTIKIRRFVDEMYFKKCTFPKGEMYIVDLRPQAAAYASGGIGGGTELECFYDCTKKLFLDLVNTQAVRKAEVLMFEEEDTKEWLALIKQNLEGTWSLFDLVVKARAEGKKITIAMHCMDGWDRTPQIITLMEILLDPRYRTMIGLAILVEKDWLAGGHQFQLRIPQPYSKNRSIKPSPVWSQMINMIWVWVKTCPELFEYGPEELLMVWREAYEGSFVGGGDGDPNRSHLSRRRSQLWHKIVTRKRHDIDPNADVSVLKNATPEIFYVSDLTILEAF